MAKEVTCGSPCRFRIRSENEEELADFVIAHVKNTHNMGLTREQALSDAKDVK